MPAIDYSKENHRIKIAKYNIDPSFNLRKLKIAIEASLNANNCKQWIKYRFS
jgi:hypothetical protein